jgi:hypothetical protein
MVPRTRRRCFHVLLLLLRHGFEFGTYVRVLYVSGKVLAMLYQHRSRD